MQSSAEGKELAEATSRLLGELLPRIEKTKDLVQGISAASEEQSHGAGQVNLAVQRLDQVVHHNAAASQQMVTTAEALSQLADELQQTIAAFQLDSAPRPAAPARLRRRAVARTSEPALPDRARQRHKSPNGAVPLLPGASDDGADDPDDQDFKKY
jgi:ABC-type transporter Mla subunit MlaD